MSEIPVASELGPAVSAGAERRIVALSIATIALYAATWFLERSMFRNGIVEPASILDPGYAANGTLLMWQMAMYVLVTAAIFVAYGAVVQMCRRGELDHGRARLWALIVPICLSLAFLVPVPRLSQDVFSYLAHGFLGVVPGGNPFLQPAEAARDTAFGPKLAALAWHTTPGITPYGILWTRLEVAIAKISAGDVLAATVLFKAVAVCASLGSAWMIWLALGRICRPIQLQCTLAFLWNPLILIEFAGEGHNDAVMIFFAIAALAACATSKPTLSIVAQLLGVLSKYVSVLFLPAQLVYLWHTRRNAGRLALGAVIAFAIAAGIAAVLYAPLWAGLRTFEGVVHRGVPISSAALFGAINWVLRRSPLNAVSGPLTTLLVTVPLLGFVAWSSLRVQSAADLARACAWISLAYLLVASPDYWPWYACMPVALIIVGDFRRLFWLAVLMSLAARLVAPLEVLRDHGFLTMQMSKGLVTGIGSTLPLVALAVWSWKQRRRGPILPIGSQV